MPLGVKNAFGFLRRHDLTKGGGKNENLGAQGLDRKQLALKASDDSCRQLPVNNVRASGTAAKSRALADDETLRDLEEMVRATADATSASCGTLRQLLNDELEVQRVLWDSAGSNQTHKGNQQGIIHGAIPGLAGLAGIMEGNGCSTFSQTQALVFVAAEAGDCKQLLAALAEAQAFSSVSESLQDAARNLHSAEEAMVTWRCLLDALQARNSSEMEIWIEQAQRLGLEVPERLSGVLAELRDIQDDLQRRLRFCLDARDPELIRQVALEAEAAGLGGMPLAREAASLAFPARRVPTKASEASSCTRLPQGDAQHRPDGSPKKPFQQDSPTTRCWHARRDWRYTSKDDDIPRSSTRLRGQSDSPSRQRDATDAATEGEFRRHVSDGSLPNTASAPSRTPPGGPGVQQGPAEAQRPPPAGPFSQHTPPAAPQRSSASADYASMSSRELLQECRRLNLNTSGCAEREDLINVLLDCKRRHRSEQSAASPQAAPWPPPTGGFRSPSAGAARHTAPTGGVRSPSVGASGHAAPSGGFRPPSRGPSRYTAAPSPASAPPRAGPALPASVWDRQRPPPHLMSKRSQALYLLGLETGPGKRTGAVEVRTAYRRVAMECHPDRLQNHARQQEAKVLFQKVKEAFDFLGSPAGGSFY